jgi:hypothetical protein
MILKATVVYLCAAIVFSSYAFKLEFKPIGAKNAPIEKAQPADDLEYWDNIEELVQSPEKPMPKLKHTETWFKNDFSTDGFGYVYGGKTAFKIQKGTNKNYSGILACYLDNNEYSGVTVCRAIGKSSNLEPLRKARAAGIGFWAKAGNGLSSVYLGLLDDDSDKKRVQTKLMLSDFGKIDTAWQYFLIPLKLFSSKGKYWDENKKTEIISDVNWKAMAEIRFSTNSRENKAAPKHPLCLYIEDISFVEDIPGYVDPSDYWASFKSNAPDILLHDFETPLDQDWEVVAGPGSEVKLAFPDPSRQPCGKRSLSISYKMYQWCDVLYNYKQHTVSQEKRDWTRYWGLKVDVFSNQGYQPFNIQVSDAGDELFIASCGAPYGWSQIIVPFKDFSKFPYYQPPEAAQNGKFDMNGVTQIDIKPSGEGSSGSFMIDNITLTNDREPQKAIVVERKNITVSGSFDSVVVAKINQGIFGINAQTWDGDLLQPKTAEMVKAVKHTFIRFPGGLTADEYHWKEVLAKKDYLVDVDEFLDFCKQTNTEPMFTVNFGSGTPQEAAEWVKYVNVDKKTGVRYWEIGNELYGSWHKYSCSAKEYGKKCAEFIKAMKAVDPSIVIGVVWQLSGDWNRIVFEYTKDIADAVIVHNYTQEIGEENDNNLLSTPQRLDAIFSQIRKQAQDNGAPGKTYRVWLTEWNSVTNNPTPQTLGMVNALFVADYLGMLAKNSIDLAAYWNIHNGIFDRGGDYGYLSRDDVPEGLNVPRPSYFAFKVARESLQGKLVLCKSDDINVAVYGTIQSDGSKNMLIINKYPFTAGDITIQIPGFEGIGSLTQITNDNVKNSMLRTQEVTIKKGVGIKIPAYSISMLRIK